MFDRGSGSVVVSRGDRAAGKLPCLRLTNPQAKSTLRLVPKPGRHNRPVADGGNGSLRQVLSVKFCPPIMEVGSNAGNSHASVKLANNLDGRPTIPGKIRRAIR